MPLIQVKLIKDVFTPGQKQEIIRKLTDAMVEIEGENMRRGHLVRRGGGRERRLGHCGQPAHDGGRQGARGGRRGLTRQRPLRVAAGHSRLGR